MSSQDRHATEHALLEALQEPGCAVCTLNRNALDAWMDSLLREGILDVKSRLRFRGGGGFCPGHTLLLEQRGSPLPVAILLHDLLTQASPVEGKPIKPRCSACAFLSEAEDRYVLLGMSHTGRLLATVHTERGASIRIISVRPVTRREAEAYSEAH